MKTWAKVLHYGDGDGYERGDGRAYSYDDGHSFDHDSGEGDGVGDGYGYGHENGGCGYGYGEGDGGGYGCDGYEGYSPCWLVVGEHIINLAMEISYERAGTVPVRV
jgi:hypothetical protein